MSARAVELLERARAELERAMPGQSPTPPRGARSIVELLELLVRESGWTVELPIGGNVPAWPVLRAACELLTRTKGPGWKERDGAIRTPSELATWPVIARSARLDPAEVLSWLTLAIAQGQAELAATIPPTEGESIP